jgi:hypothetical protein
MNRIVLVFGVVFLAFGAAEIAGGTNAQPCNQYNSTSACWNSRVAWLNGASSGLWGDFLVALGILFVVFGAIYERARQTSNPAS